MSVNKVILVGFLGRDPEIRYMSNGDTVANLNLATNESWKDRNGVKQTKTEWHRVTMYRKLADIAKSYLKQGSQIYIEGKIQTREYVDNNGIKRTITEVIASEMTMLGNKTNSTQTQQNTQAQPQPTTQSNDYAKAKTGTAVPQAANAGDDIPDPLDDEIPF